MQSGLQGFLATCLAGALFMGVASCGGETAQADVPAATHSDAEARTLSSENASFPSHDKAKGAESVSATRAASKGAAETKNMSSPVAGAAEEADSPRTDDANSGSFTPEVMAHFKAMGRKGCESNLMTNRWYDCGCYGDVVGEAYAQSRLEKEARGRANLEKQRTDLDQLAEAMYNAAVKSRNGGDISDLGDQDSYKEKVFAAQLDQMRRTYKLDKDPMTVKYLEVMSGAAMADVNACKAQAAVHAKTLEDCARSEAISNHREDPASYCGCKADETVRLWKESALGLNGVVGIMSKAGVTCAQKYPAEPF